jgi:hypothetical protein
MIKKILVFLIVFNMYTASNAFFLEAISAAANLIGGAASAVKDSFDWSNSEAKKIGDIQMWKDITNTQKAITDAKDSYNRTEALFRSIEKQKKNIENQWNSLIGLVSGVDGLEDLDKVAKQWDRIRYSVDIFEKHMGVLGSSSMDLSRKLDRLIGQNKTEDAKKVYEKAKGWVPNEEYLRYLEKLSLKNDQMIKERAARNQRIREMMARYKKNKNKNINIAELNKEYDKKVDQKKSEYTQYLSELAKRIIDLKNKSFGLASNMTAQRNSLVTIRIKALSNAYMFIKGIASKENKQLEGVEQVKFWTGVTVTTKGELVFDKGEINTGRLEQTGDILMHYANAYKGKYRESVERYIRTQWQADSLLAYNATKKLDLAVAATEEADKKITILMQEFEEFKNGLESELAGLDRDYYSVISSAFDSYVGVRYEDISDEQKAENIAILLRGIR